MRFPIVVAFLAVATPAVAQPAASRWSIEFHGGVAAGTTPNAGTVSFPPPGAPLVTPNPIFPTWRVPSWFFGDGALMLNNAITDFGLTAHLTPLDGAINARAFRIGVSGVAGARIRRAFSPRLALEGTVDLLAESTDVRDLESALTATPQSFKTTFTALFASGPFVNTAVSADGVIHTQLSREVAATAAINWSLAPSLWLAPYVTGGGGVIAAAGGSSSLTLDGHYQTTIRAGSNPDVPIEEFDHVVVRSSTRTNWIAVAGAGIARGRSTWTMNVDARVLMGPGNHDVIVSATPSSTRGTPSDSITLLSYPALQFSNNPSTGRESTLSGPGVQDFKVFRGAGIQTRTLITVGFAYHFNIK